MGNIIMNRSVEISKKVKEDSYFSLVVGRAKIVVTMAGSHQQQNYSKCGQMS